VHERGVIAGKEGGDRRHLLRVRVAPRRRVLDDGCDLLRVLLDAVLGHTRLHESRTDGRGSDLRDVFVGQLLREADHAVLRGRVRGAAGRRAPARDRGSVDDHATTIRLKRRQRRIRRQEDSFAVHGHRSVPDRFVDRFDRLEAIEHPGVVAEHVEAPEAVGHRVDGGIENCRFGNVYLLGQGRPPPASMLAAVSSAADPSMSTQTMSAPRAANVVLIARPIPEPAPVIHAARSLRSVIDWVIVDRGHIGFDGSLTG